MSTLTEIAARLARDFQQGDSSDPDADLLDAAGKPGQGVSAFTRTYQGLFSAPDDLIIEVDETGATPAGDGTWPLTDVFVWLSNQLLGSTAGRLQVRVYWQPREATTAVDDEGSEQIIPD